MSASLAPLLASLTGRLLHVDALLVRRNPEPTAHPAGDVCPSFGNGYHPKPVERQRPIQSTDPILSFASVTPGSQGSCARQAEAECRSSFPCVLGHKVTMLGPREISGDGEPETRAAACAAGAGGLRPVEAIEDTG
jgi:hypothetical protein